MKSIKEYRKDLKHHRDSLRREFPEPERLKEIITRELERLGMTFEQFFQPNTFAQTLQDKRSPLLEAIALASEERDAMKKRQSSKSS